jgi:hypothetical protein
MERGKEGVCEKGYVCVREKRVGVEGERRGENTHNAPIAVPD